MERALIRIFSGQFPSLTGSRRRFSATRFGRLVTGFTLVELLVVIVIIGVMFSLIAPSAGNVISSAQVTQASEALVGQIAAARQHAMAFNCTMEFRLYKLPGNGTTLTAYRAVWLVKPGEAGSPATAFQRPFRLPDGVIIGENTALSTLMDSNVIPEQTDTLPFPGVGNGCAYRVIRFYADGSTDLPLLNQASEDKWFLTIYRARQASETNLSNSPKNYSTIQIFRKTGSVSIYRP